MKPLKLVMTAFGSYVQETVIDFGELGDGIFLITGDTGAGKTTIFDAIAFALYGETSGQRRDGSMMRSQSARPDRETRVELTFSDGGEVYRIVRSPSYLRQSLRRNKNGEYAMTESGARASLFLPDGSEFPGRIADVNARIRAIVGVDRSQFAQTAMIAQGEYLRLLLASSKERKEIFSKLFDTGIYAEIQKKLRERSGALAGRLEENRGFYLREAARIRVPQGTEGGQKGMAKGEGRLTESPAADGWSGKDGRNVGNGGEARPFSLKEGQDSERKSLSEAWEKASGLLESSPEEIIRTAKAICRLSREDEKREQEADEGRISRLGELGKRIEAARAAAGLREKEREARRRHVFLTGRREEMEENRKRLLLAQRAVPLQVKEGELRAKRGELCQTERKIKEAEETLRELSGSLAAAERKKEEAEAVFRERQPILLSEAEGIRASLPLYDSLEELLSAARIAEKEQKKAEAGRRQAGGEKETCTLHLEELRRERKEKEDSRLFLEQSRQRGKILARRREEVNNLGKRLSELAEQSGRLEKKRAGITAGERAYREASASYDRLNREFILSQAGFLAAELKEGEACPVCGSAVHPHPARLVEGHVTKEQLDAARQERDQRDTELQAQAGELKAMQAGFDAKKEQCAGEYKRVRAEEWEEKAAGGAGESRNGESDREGWNGESDRESRSSGGDGESRNGESGREGWNGGGGREGRNGESDREGRNSERGREGWNGGGDREGRNGESDRESLSSGADGENWGKREEQPFDIGSALEEMEGLCLDLKKRERENEEATRKWEQAALRLQEVNHLIQEGEARLGELDARERAAAEAEGQAAEQAARLNARARERKTQLRFHTREEADRRLLSVGRELSALTESRDTASRERERLKEEERLWKGRLASEEEKRREQAEEKERIRREFQRTAGEAGFSGEEEYRRAILEEKERERLSDEIARYERELAVASAELKRCGEELGKASEEEEEPLREEEGRLLAERREAGARLRELASISLENEKAFAAVKELLAERKTLREEYQVVNLLSSTADGRVSGTARLDFQTYVQRQYFARMIRAANRRLKRMTGGRFVLRCRELEALGGRGEAGLDLDVYSAETDSVRDIKTLSGGESFLAALSMALGMADVIQDTAGSVELDALFIDEGFGSLDDEARARAVGALKELSGGKRMIGIISHVAELKEQIGKRIVVKKGQEGSFVRVEREEG